MPMLIFCSLNFESNGAVSCLGTYGLFASRMCRLLHPSRLGVLLGRADEVIEEPAELKVVVAVDRCPLWVISGHSPM